MEKKYCFGIDVGGTTVKCALFEADGNIADKWEITTHVENQGERILPDIDLSGQWSIDIMQNGDDFYIIDMALAANSALKECVPPGLLKPVQEKWIPKLPDLTAQD